MSEKVQSTIEKLKEKRSGSRTYRSGLFHRYFYITGVIIFASFTILGIALITFVITNWEAEKIDLLSQNAKSVAASSTTVVEKGVVGTDDGYTAMLLSNTLFQVSKAIDADIYICDINGDVVCCKDMWRDDFVVDENECIVHRTYKIPKDVIERARAGGFTDKGILSGVYRRNQLLSVEPIIVSDEMIGVVVAAQETDALRGPVSTMVKMFVLSALVALVIAFISTYIFTYQMAKPLIQMSAATKQYSNGDFSNRISVRPQTKLLKSDIDEIDELVNAFNSMANALSAIETSRRNFVANVSHELKTPMTTIGGFIDGILDGTIDEKQSKYYLGIVSDEVKRLARLVTSMLNMSKIEAGQLDINPKTFDISNMILKTLLSFERVIDGKVIDVRGLDRMASIDVCADEDMINQVIYNLIDNAVKFTPEGGYIEAEVKADRTRTIVSIKNSGKGIPKEDVDKIFERFYKTDKSRSFDIKGAGLGLYIVKTIIDMHGGKIAAYSVEGEYTQFVFWLPKK